MRSVHLFNGETARTISVPRSHRYEELQRIAGAIMGAIVATDIVFVEEPPLAGPKNIRTLIGLSQTHGAVIASSPGYCYSVPVATWKKDVVGNGKADKTFVAEWLERNHPSIYARCANQDQIDAACIHMYGKLVMDRLSLGS